MLYLIENLDRSMFFFCYFLLLFLCKECTWRKEIRAIRLDLTFLLQGILFPLQLEKFFKERALGKVVRLWNGANLFI